MFIFVHIREKSKEKPLKSGRVWTDRLKGKFFSAFEDRDLRNIRAQAFCFIALCTCMAGCMGTYWKGSSETHDATPVAAAPEEQPAPQPESSQPDPAPGIRLPIYEDDRNSVAWSPDLRPLPRSCWALSPPRTARLRAMGKITKITIHHEGNPQPNVSGTLAEVANDLRLISKVHVDQNNAGDIGYHFIIDRAGRIWEGRSLNFTGAHAGGEANEGNIGVMVLGNFDLQEPTNEQKTSLKAFLRLLADRFKLSSRSILTHREIKPTRCPGDRLQSFIDKIRFSL